MSNKEIIYAANMVNPYDNEKLRDLIIACVENLMELEVKLDKSHNADQAKGGGE